MADDTAPRGKVPDDLPSYLEWCRSKLGHDYDDPKVRNAYETTLAAASDAIGGSPLWTSLPAVVGTVAEAYRNAHSCELLSAHNTTPPLLKKSFESAVNKTFRLNVLWNRNYPDPPKDGFVTPLNWFDRLDDVLRATLVCRYVDGPSSIIDGLRARATELEIEHTVRTVSRDEGYYGHHFYARHPTTVVGHDGSIRTASVSIELQVTTQMQDLLRSLTHRFYEEDRLQRRPDSSWKWDFTSRKFRARYLAHTLHLVEALVVTVRDGSD